jgi:hypothetical protein
VLNVIKSNGALFMTRSRRLLWLTVVISSNWLVSCVHHHQSSSGESSAKAAAKGIPGHQATNPVSKEVQHPEKPLSKPADQEGIEAILARSQQDYEERNHHPEILLHPPPSEWLFPNPEGPQPLGVNFYRIEDHYADYLLCQFDIDENPYDPSKEPEYFKSALRQVRHSSKGKFPRIKWVTVMIVNRGEFKGPSPSEQCCKVGSIFRASEVFSHWRNLSRLVAHADLDRHPFLFDKRQPTPGQQDRWLIVERHAELNLTRQH